MGMSDLINSSVDVYGMFHALEDQLIARYPGSRRSVADCRESLAMAMGYVYGREDAGDRPIVEAYGREVIAYHEFGYMYGIVCLMYKLEMIFMKPSIGHAWGNFRASRELTAWGS